MHLAFLCEQVKISSNRVGRPLSVRMHTFVAASAQGRKKECLHCKGSHTTSVVHLAWSGDAMTGVDHKTKLSVIITVSNNYSQ